MNETKTLKYNGWTEDIVYCIPDIVYSTREGRNLKLHLVLPLDFHYAKKYGYTIDRNFPLIVSAKGSGFTHPEYNQFIGRACRIAEHGFIVAMVEYSNFLEGCTFLDTCLDFKTAIRFLRAHAAEYHIDANKVAAWGTSSGASDATFAAFSGDDPKYKTDEYPEYSDSVDVVIDINGPVDINAFTFSGSRISGYYQEYWRTHTPSKDPKELGAEASSINLVGESKLPPILIAHGTADPIVDYSQSVNLFKKLCDFNHEAVFYSIEGAGHGSAFTSELLEECISFINKAFEAKG